MGSGSHHSWWFRIPTVQNMRSAFTVSQPTAAVYTIMLKFQESLTNNALLMQSLKELDHAGSVFPAAQPQVTSQDERDP